MFGCDAVYVRPSGFYSTNYGYPILVVTNLGLMLGSYGLVFWQMNRYYHMRFFVLQIILDRKITAS